MARKLIIIPIVILFLIPEIMAQVVLQRCDRTDLWASANSLSIDSGDKKEGMASIQCTGSETDWFAKVFSQVYTGVDETGYLSLWLYISDPAVFTGTGKIIVSSSGGYDTDKYSWDMSSLGLTAGWNELVLSLASATSAGSPDLDAINYFGMYQDLSASITAKLDDIRFLESASPEPSGDPLDIQPVDFNTLDGKVMFGYQGWFLTKGDGSTYNRWRHWGSGDKEPVPGSYSVDMLPDMREYEADELFEASEFTYSDGRTLKLYSAYTKKTVVRHMKWLRDYGLDGVFLQRFISNTTNSSLRAARDTVTANIRYGCEKYGRTFVNMWDLSNFDGKPMSIVINDWKHLVDDMDITGSPNYLHHRGRPLVAIWGFTVRDYLTENHLKELMDFFTSESTPEKYRASVMLGVNHDFHSRTGWHTEMARADVISPWAVGRFGNDEGQNNFMNSHVLPGQNWCDQRNVDFLPVIWPGFSWYNLKPNEVKNKRPRRGGNFIWTQANRVISGNAKSVYIAMFDEVDEATAMFKLAETDDQTPQQGYWLALDADGYDLPSDWYLRCAKLATEIVRGNVDNRTRLGTPPDGIDVFSVWPVASRCGESNGSLSLKYPGTTPDRLYEFSIDGGVSYPHLTPANTSELSLEGLPAGVYEVWVRNEDDTYPTDLGPYTIFDSEPMATVGSRDASCHGDGAVTFLINDLPYVGDVQISVDSGISYDYTSSPGIWKDEITGLLPGEYTVWIRSAEGDCPSELATVSISDLEDPIVIYPMLDGKQMADESDTVYACNGSSLYLFCFPADAGLSWMTMGPNEFISDSRNIVISGALTGDQFGEYTITYSAPNGCLLQRDYVVTLDPECQNTAARDLTQANNVAVFPNPVSSVLYLEGLPGDCHIEIFSILGNKVFSVAATGGSTELDLSELPGATYYLTVKNEEFSTKQILIKQ